MKTKPVITVSNQHENTMKTDDKLKKLIEIKKKYNHFDMNKLKVVEREF